MNGAIGFYAFTTLLGLTLLISLLTRKTLEKAKAEAKAAATPQTETEKAAAQDARRVELGVEDGILDIEGVTLPMSVALGENDVKTVEDFAGLIPDDLRGWYETKNGERVREPGILEAFNLSPEDAEALIMRARVIMGWVDAEALAQPEGELVYSEEDAALAEASEE